MLNILIELKEKNINNFKEAEVMIYIFLSHFLGVRNYCCGRLGIEYRPNESNFCHSYDDDDLSYGMKNNYVIWNEK